MRRYNLLIGPAPIVPVVKQDGSVRISGDYKLTTNQAAKTLPETPARVPDPGETVLLMDILETSVVTAAQIKAWTVKDPVLSQVQDMILQGKAPSDTEELQPYKSRLMELSIHMVVSFGAQE